MVILPKTKLRALEYLAKHGKTDYQTLYSNIYGARGSRGGSRGLHPLHFLSSLINLGLVNLDHGIYSITREGRKQLSIQKKAKEE